MFHRHFTRIGNKTATKICTWAGMVGTVDKLPFDHKVPSSIPRSTEI